MTVDAAGALRPGTSDLVAGRDLAETFVRFAGARLSGIGLAESKGEARIAVFNPFRFDVALRSIRYELSSGGREVARGSRQGVLVRPGRENEIVLPLTVGNAAAIAAAGKAVASGGKLSGRLTGQLVLKLGTGDVKIPLDGLGDDRGDEVTSPLRVERPRPGVARVVLDRPELRNAFDDVLIARLTEAFEALGRRRLRPGRSSSRGREGPSAPAPTSPG